MQKQHKNAKTYLNREPKYKYKYKYKYKHKHGDPYMLYLHA